MSTLLIIDTFGLIFRAYHAYPLMNTADGRQTNAIFGFIQMLLTSIDKIGPDYIMCSLESETPTFRHELAADYKANRKEMDPELREQISGVIEVIQSLGITILQKNGFEADDVIGSFAVQNKDKFDQIKVITGDRDLLQLLSENIKIMMPGKTFSDFIEFDEQKFVEKYNIPLEDFVLYKSIIGDTSDNIKGIPGVGPKGAEKIISQYHSIDSILANLDQLPPRVAETITEHQELWRKYYQLCKIDTSIQTEIKPEDIKVSKLQAHRLRTLCDKYEFKTLQKRIAKFTDTFEKKYGGFGLFDDAFGTANTKTEVKNLLVESVTFEQDLLANELNQSRSAYVISTATGYRLGNGVDFVDVATESLYNFVITNQLKSFYGFDIKPFLKDLMSSGIEHIEKINVYDLKLAWHLIRSHETFETLNELANHVKIEDYKAIIESTNQELQAANLTSYFEMESELQKVLAHMEFSGIRCDKEYLMSIQSEFEAKIADIKQKLFDFVGFEFNPASTRDLGHVLFEVLNLPVQKKNKTGYSTDDSTLTKLEGMSEIIPLIKAFRTYSKTLSTYVIGLQNVITEDDKIHTTYNQTLVATGRVSSINPNLQNLPADSHMGVAIKKAFKPSSDSKFFLSLDYSQIDLRVLAFVSGDENLRNAFIHDEDIHTTTAKLIFEKDEITKTERGFAKTINFGIVYGMEPYGLSQALKIDQTAAKGFIDRYFEKFPGVKHYFATITKQLDEVGYVNTPMGRRRYFPTWSNTTGFQKRMLFREAINMPIQGGTAEIIKVAMNKAFKYLQDNKINATLLLQIHDELVFEIDRSEDIEAIKEKLKDIMIHAYDIEIPVKVSLKEGSDLTFIGSDV